MTQKANYSITNLGILPGFEKSRAIAVSDNGQVVGTLQRDDFDFNPYGFLWHEGVMSGLGDVIPYDINNKSQIIGISRKTYLEFIAHVENRKSSPKHNTLHWDQEINENGQVVGFSQFTNRNMPSKSKRIPFILENGKRGSLSIPEGYNSGEAMGINSQGIVVGNVWLQDVSDKHAVVWQEDAVRPLGEPKDFTNTEAKSVNDLGQILVKAYRSNLAELLEQAAGSAELDKGTAEASQILANSWEFKQQSYLWHRGQWQAIGGMSLAHALNNQGQVVGSVWIDPKKALRPNERAGNHAALWEDGEMMDLNEVLPENWGWALHEATEINNLGQIVGDGVFENKPCAFLLTPKHL